MNSQITKSRVYRLLIIVFTAILLSSSWTVFYNFLRSPTDENIFRDVDARLAFVKNLRGTLISKKTLQGAQPKNIVTSFDSVLAGDLLLSINDGKIATIKDAYDALYNSPTNTVRLDVLRSQLNEQLSFSVNRSNIQEESFALLPHYALIIDVTSGGASDRAGLKVGDLIIGINNKEFKTALEADRILRLGQIGKSLEYEILRSNKYLKLNVVLAKFGIPVSVLIFCLSGTLFMFIGFFIAVSRPNIFAALLIGFCLLFVGYVMMMIPIRRDTELTLLVILGRILFAGSVAAGIATFFHAMHYFPIERPELTNKKWIARGYYILSAATIAVSYFYDNPFSFFLTPAYAFYIFIKYRKLASAEYKRLNKLIKLVYSFTTVVSIIVIIFFNNKLGIIGFGIYGILLLCIPLSYLYTIGRYRLLDLNLRVRRNIQYSIVTVIWSIAVFYFLTWIFFQLPQINFPKTNIVFTGASIEVSDSPKVASNYVPAERVLLMLTAITVTFIFMRIRVIGQRLVDKKYFRAQYDYRKAQQDLGELLATTLSMEDLGKGFVQKLSEIMRLKIAGVIFFKDEKNCSCVAVHGFNGEHWKKFCLSKEIDLVKAIKQFQNETLIQYLPPYIKEEFLQEGFQYVIPIHSKDKLIGTILVGEKLSETTFQQEDLSFLSTTAKQASVAIENAFLYEELTEKERMKHELEIARRIQLDSLPQSLPNIHEFDIAGTSLPAMEVGGDFFDYLINTDNRLTVIIGDVSGKGTSAALYMSKVQGILRSLHGFNLSPKELFTRANKLLCTDLEKRSFVTALGAEFNTGKKSVVIARAGHLPLWHYKARVNLVATILPKGLGLGLDDAGIFSSEIEEMEIAYDPGDIFLFTTDGVTDARNHTEDFGENRLLRILKTHQHETASELQKIILHEISLFAVNTPQHDDQTIIVVKAR